MNEKTRPEFALQVVRVETACKISGRVRVFKIHRFMTENYHKKTSGASAAAAFQKLPPPERPKWVVGVRYDRRAGRKFPVPKAKIPACRSLDSR
jgi:hypothetical protein